MRAEGKLLEHADARPSFAARAHHLAAWLRARGGAFSLWGAGATGIALARALERLGDHATNVAEMIYFAATGTQMTERGIL